ncbi:MAG: class II fructose-bisphosphate aldolase [Gemmiger sp.]
MPLVKNQKDLYEFAVKNKFTMPAMHMSGLASLRAILDAAQEEDSPIIIQLMGPTLPMFQPFDKFMEFFEAICNEYTIPILLNHDHNPSVENCKKCIDMGFPSVMFDGSSLPYEENVAKTKEVADYAHAHNAWVEAELGSIPGLEDMVIGPDSCIYTSPEQAVDFIKATGCDSLAVAVGTAHGGVRADAPLDINFELLGKIREAVGDSYPLVLHGAASLPTDHIDAVNALGGKVEYLKMCTEETIRKTSAYGVAKANMDVDNFLVITAKVREFLAAKPDVYAHVHYMFYAMAGLKEEVKRKIRDVTNSGGFGSKFYQN